MKFRKKPWPPSSGKDSTLSTRLHCVNQQETITLNLFTSVLE